MEYNFNNEKAGKPYPKTFSALEVCLILSLSKDPYPNKQEMICSEPIISPAAAGAERKSESSTDLFCKNFTVLSDLLFRLVDKTGQITVPTAIPVSANGSW